MKHFYLILLVIFSMPLHAEMIDTFQFHSDEERMRGIQLAKSFRCLQCPNQNLVESNADAAYQMRLQIYQMVNEGKRDQEIRQIMIEKFGNGVSYEPPLTVATSLLWGMPAMLLLFMLGSIIWRSQKKRKIVK